MQRSPPLPLASCPQCGAGVPLEAATCWLCRGRLAAEDQPLLAEAVGAPGPRDGLERLSAAATLLVAILVVLIAIGLAVDQPGMLIPYGIVIVPALAATVIRATVRRGRGAQVGWGEKLLTFIVSAGIVIFTLCLLAAAALAALVAYCFVELGRM